MADNIKKYCYAHQSSMTMKYSKNKMDASGNPKPYWSHIDSSGKMCFGVGKPEAGEYQNTVDEINKAEEVSKSLDQEFENLVSKEEPSEMTAEEKMWRDKEERAAQREKEKSEQISRLTLAKTYIQAGVTFDSAMQDGDLDKWIAWVLNNEVI